MGIKMPGETFVVGIYGMAITTGSQKVHRTTT